MVYLYVTHPYNFAFERGERGGASFGAGAAVNGSKFPLSRWSQGCIELPNREGEAGSHRRQKFQRRPATVCIVSCSILILG